MPQKIARVAITLLLVATVVATVHAQDSKVYPFQYRLSREGSDNFIIVTWQTNFAATGSTYRAVAKNQGQETITDHRTLQPTRKPINSLDGTAVIGTEFTVKLKYGGGSGINENTDTLELTVTPFVGTEASPTTSKTAELSVHMPTVKDYFILLTKSITPATPEAPPTISDAAVVKVSDTSITVKARSPQFIKAKAFAFPTSNPAAVASMSTDFVSDEELLFDNRPREITVKNLSPNINYVVVIRESFTPSPGSRQAAQAVLALDPNNNNPLRTLPAIPRPTVSVISRPVNKKNKAAAVTLRVSNTAKLTATVLEQDTLGNFYQVGTPFDIVPPSPPASAPSSDVFVRPEIPALLSPDKTYRVMVRAFSANPDVAPVDASPSETFQGKPASLFDIVFVDMSGTGVKFVPRQVNELVTMSVTAVLNNGSTITVPCPGGASTSPECNFPTTAVFSTIGAATTNPPSNPSPTTLPATLPNVADAAINALIPVDLPVPSTDTKRSTAKFFVTVKANDDSAREQTQVFALSIAGPATPAANTAWKRVVDFGRSLVAPSTGNKSIDTNNVRPTGVGAILGMLLKTLAI